MLFFGTLARNDIPFLRAARIKSSELTFGFKKRSKPFFPTFPMDCLVSL